MKMKSNLKSFGILVIILSSIHANLALAQTLVLHHADGTTTDVELLSQPQVKFQNGKVLITSTILNMEYPKENVLTFTFKGKSTGIHNVKSDLKVTKEKGQIVFHGVKSSEKIALYNLKGIRIPVKIQYCGENVALPLSAIPSGTYLLNVNGKTSKFTKP